MNTNEKIARVKTLLGDNSISDDKIAVYLDLAKSEILNRLYQLYDAFSACRNAPDVKTALWLVPLEQ